MSDPIPTKNSRRFAELFVEIERQFGVNSIAIEGVHLWPLIRGRLRKPFKIVDNPPPGELERKASAASGWRSRFLGMITHLLHPVQSPNEAPPVITKPRAGERQNEKIRSKAPVLSREAAEVQAAAELDKIRQAGQVDFVVFARPNKYYQKFGAKRYAPILDPVYEDLQARGRVVALCEGAALDFECVNPPVVFDTTAYMSLRRYFPRPVFPEALSRMEDIQRIVSAIEPSFGVEPGKVLFRYNSHAHKRKFYREVFASLKPRIVFFSSFTSWVPVTWACREMGIPTVDIQHGGQSSHHGYNTHYSCVPRDGYHMLPDFFWCWGFHNKEIIRRWFPGGACRHIPLVGGNRWKAKWIGSRSLAMLSVEERAFVESLEARKPAILVTPSHGVEELLPRHLIEAMRHTPSWFWLIRLHPINRSPETERRVRATLERAGLNNYDTQYSTLLPLHVVLQHVHYHLTPFSTAAREAVDFGVPTMIIDPIGKVDFAEDIAEGVFAYADTVGDIRGEIERAIRSERDTKAPSFLETDDKYVNQLLDTVNRWRLPMLLGVTQDEPAAEIGR